MCDKYAEIFNPSLVTIPNFKPHIHLKDNAKRKFFGVRPASFAQLPHFKEKIES